MIKIILSAIFLVLGVICFITPLFEIFIQVKKYKLQKKMNDNLTHVILYSEHRKDFHYCSNIKSKEYIFNGDFQIVDTIAHNFSYYNGFLDYYYKNLKVEPNEQYVNVCEIYNTYASKANHITDK